LCLAGTPIAPTFSFQIYNNLNDLLTNSINIALFRTLCILPIVSNGVEVFLACNSQGKEMLDIVKMSEELRSKLQREADSLISDRLMMRDVLEARTRELLDKRDAEISRIEDWAKEQRRLVQEIFAALLQETESDRFKNDESLQRMAGGGLGSDAVQMPTRNMAKGVSESRSIEWRKHSL
jgi:hypothetical protein